MATSPIDTIFKDSINKLNSILMYLDHQLGTVSLTKEEITALGGVKNTVQPAHNVGNGEEKKRRKRTKKKNLKKKEKPQEKKEKNKKKNNQKLRKREWIQMKSLNSVI